MLDRNVNKVLNMLRETDVVLDIGGWACPFNRANHVLDLGPYETRGYYKTVGLPASQGGEKEYFTRDTWIQRDLCSREPYPFADKSIDFVICSHTLEDIRDPLWVCSEMIRIAKRGYIEVPSRLCESCRGWENSLVAGLSHHRWLIDITDSHISFLMKFHMISSHWKFSLPRRVLKSLSKEQQVSWLFWEDSFTFEEKLIHSIDAQGAELERFRESIEPVSPRLRKLDQWIMAKSGENDSRLNRLWRAFF